MSIPRGLGVDHDPGIRVAVSEGRDDSGYTYTKFWISSVEFDGAIGIDLRVRPDGRISMKLPSEPLLDPGGVDSPGRNDIYWFGQCLRVAHVVASAHRWGRDS